MPIFFELLFILLAAFAVGLGIGWLVWGRKHQSDKANSDSAQNTGATSDE